MDATSLLGTQSQTFGLTEVARSAAHVEAAGCAAAHALQDSCAVPAHLHARAATPQPVSAHSCAERQQGLLTCFRVAIHMAWYTWLA